MAQLSAEVLARARKNVAVCASRFATTGQAPIAEALGCSVSTVSRMVSNDLEPMMQALAVLGMKVVPAEFRCVDPDEYATLVKWAIKRLEDVDRDPDSLLRWEPSK